MTYRATALTSAVLSRLGMGGGTTGDAEYAGGDVSDELVPACMSNARYNSDASTGRATCPDKISLTDILR